MPCKEGYVECDGSETINSATVDEWKEYAGIIGLKGSVGRFSLW